MRRKWSWGALLGALFLLTGWSLPALSAEKVELVLDWVINSRHSGFFVAKDLGLYQKAGVDVSISRGTGSGDTVKRISIGKGEFGFADAGTTILARARGAKVKQLGVLFNISPMALGTLKSRGIQTIQDVLGKKIGGGAASATQKLFPALARANGLKGYELVALDPAQTHPALLAGKVDLISTFVDNVPALRQGLKPGDEVIMIRYADHGLDTYGNGLLATDERIEKQPDLLRRFLKTSFEGVAWAIDHPEEAVDRFLKYTPALERGPQLERWLLNIPLYWTEETKRHGLGYMSQEKMEKTRDLLFEAYGIKERLPIEETYTLAFLPKVFAQRK